MLSSVALQSVQLSQLTASLDESDGLKEIAMHKKYFDPCGEDIAFTGLSWFMCIVAVAAVTVAGLALFKR